MHAKVLQRIEPGRALRIGGGEENAHRPALRDSHQERAPRSSGVHDRHEVVHALFQRGELLHWIRETSAAPVEEDQPREARQPLEERAEGRLFPRILDVGDPTGNEHQIDVPMAYHLVGDVDVSAFRVSGLRDHGRLRTRDVRKAYDAIDGRR